MSCIADDLGKHTEGCCPSFLGCHPHFDDNRQSPEVLCWRASRCSGTGITGLHHFVLVAGLNTASCVSPCGREASVEWQRGGGPCGARLGWEASV
jgi:hypothetical protein